MCQKLFLAWECNSTQIGVNHCLSGAKIVGSVGLLFVLKYMPTLYLLVNHKMLYEF